MAKRDTSVKSFVLRVDGETMEALEKWAADEFRSINGQLQWIIAVALRRSGRMLVADRQQKRAKADGVAPDIEQKGDGDEKAV